MRDLAELSLEELWELFPIILADYNEEYPQWFAEKAAEVRQIVPSITRLTHIGSTAVPGLVSKPTIDMLLESTLPREELIRLLRGAGWVLHSDTELGIVFNQGYTPHGFADRVFHLHVRPPGDYDEIVFRDYLIAHPDVARDYVELKKDLSQRYKHHRDNYTDAKGPFIADVIRRTRA